MIEYKIIQISEDHWDIYIKGDRVYKIRGGGLQYSTLEDVKTNVTHYRYSSPLSAKNAAIKQIMGG